jgi:hypothetical protein
LGYRLLLFLKSALFGEFDLAQHFRSAKSVDILIFSQKFKQLIATIVLYT